MAHDAASAYFRTPTTPLPMLVTATRLGRGAIARPDQPLAVVMGLLLQEDARYDGLRQLVNRAVREAIYQGGTLLLVDGLDEASAAEQAAVFRLLGEIGTNQAALASRPTAYGGQLGGWQIADLQQLGAEQRRELVI